MMESFFIAICIATGLILGSFFNVLIWRLPRSESIIAPGSHCPACGRHIRPWENIPVLSFIMLGGKCAGCRAAISWRYPAVELLTAALCLLLWQTYVSPYAAIPHRAADHITFVLRIASLLVLIPVAFIDLEHFIIPDSITLPGLAVGILASFFPGPLTPLQMLLGTAAGGGTLMALGALGEYVFKKDEAMGGGDIKLMAFLGALWGWKAALLAIVFGSVLGACATLPLLAAGRLPADRRIPFGPFLAAGTWIAALYGDQCVRAYFTFTGRLLF